MFSKIDRRAILITNIFLICKVGESMEEKIGISTDFIPLGQFLKLANILDSGGMIKVFLQENGVYVNDELETRRGKKLYPGDTVYVEDVGTFVVTKSDE